MHYIVSCHSQHFTFFLIDLPSTLSLPSPVFSPFFLMCALVYNLILVSAALCHTNNTFSSYCPRFTKSQTVLSLLTPEDFSSPTTIWKVRTNQKVSAHQQLEGFCLPTTEGFSSPTTWRFQLITNYPDATHQYQSEGFSSPTT